MNKQLNDYHNYTRLLSAICSGVVLSLSAIPHSATAQEVSTPNPMAKVNPCPSIFYQEPYNSKVLVPEGCPLNAVTQQLAIKGQTPIRSNPNNSEIAELPSQTTPSNTTTQPQVPPKQSPIAYVMPTNDRVGVLLTNETNAPIIYQVIGDTETRTLAGRTSVELRDLHTPTSIAFYRQDHGLLMVTPEASSKPGMLSVKFSESTDFANDNISMTIQKNGNVFLN